MGIGVGGPIENVGIDGRGFSVAHDAGASRDLGGLTNTVEMNGDGTGRIVKERRPFMIEGLQLDIDDDAGDQEFLQAVADKKEFVAIDVTFANGATYGGQGTITDTLSYDAQKSLAEVKLSGVGLTKQ